MSEGKWLRGSRLREPSVEERPRERLLRAGPQALSDAELIAVLLRTGKRGTSAMQLAREVLQDCGGLLGLQGVGAETVRREGLGPAKVATLLASVELGRRFARAELPEKDPMTHPEIVARYLFLRFGVRDQEVMGALYLDTRNRLLAESETFRGTLNRAAVEPGALLKTGLLHGAAGLVVFHTHPSGDPSPSAEDLAFTRRLAEAGRTVGIRLVDHLILGSGQRWLSLRQRGAW